MHILAVATKTVTTHSDLRVRFLIGRGTVIACGIVIVILTATANGIWIVIGLLIATVTVTATGKGIRLLSLLQEILPESLQRLVPLRLPSGQGLTNLQEPMNRMQSVCCPPLLQCSLSPTNLCSFS